MNIIFVEPAFPANQRRFVHALASVGANVYGIGESDETHLGPDLRGAMRGYYRVGSVTNVQQLIDAVRHFQAQVWVDGLEATIEAHTMPAAQAREATGVPGTNVRTTWLCRDKPSMKEALRAAGVPTAASAAIDSSAEAKEFADRVGYPLIVKPRTGAGAQGTVRVDGDDELADVLHQFGEEGATSLAIEEFVEGHEGFYDTITLDGRVTHDWVTHYYPNVLEAMRHRWISPQFVTTNRVDGNDFYAEVRELGRRVVDALGIETSATHMEWFYGPKGLRFSEIGCRPPGVGAWDLYSAANEIDVYREWAHVVVHGRPEHQMKRSYAAGLVALRPDRDGVVTGYDGIDAVESRYGDWVIDAHFPPPGQPTQPVEAGFMANAWVRLRHPDYDTLRGMLDDVGRTVKVHAG
ncbi:ATP-grasp domain-containing protein [Intrasporangium calvum]|uniref:ATP-dependent carboxylate-amine ligase domain protein ATP-grasp n=1 Tax=Intrasporangium calvum (strain ATCC 23552 / DSM 43043 / JCM 3097 / NBRC 12989 / NCIMB 10167 / NRRL B-3866 / 7 KIP) TaxID=710696 RepID=E6SFC0_INTC7|nr:ATP-grasp domain-containing protein [Intrasporangium calvum]ADU46658.1 ATP-dependent carboxylate-amine ligase domain protein ATP-grasp [Intrasporangium calvum DSM 43043]